jgi:hypothetical protein
MVLQVSQQISAALFPLAGDFGELKCLNRLSHVSETITVEQTLLVQILEAFDLLSVEIPPADEEWINVRISLEFSQFVQI